MKRTLHTWRLAENSLWRHRDVRIVVPARAIAVAGDGMAMVALLLRTHDAGHGPAAVTGLMVCFALPVVLLMGYAGQVADTRDSRHVLVAAGLAQVLACVGLVFSESLLTTYGLVIVLQAGQAFASPVWQALVPRIVGDEHVGRVIAWQQGLRAATAPVGAALGGVLVGVYGAPIAFWCNAGTFALLVVASVLVRTRRGGSHDATLRPAGARGTGHGGGSVFAGVRVLQRDGVLWPLFCALMPLVVVLEGVNVVEVFLVRDALHASPAEYGVSEVAFGVGAVTGSVVVGRISSDRGRTLAVLWGLAVTAAMVVAQGLAPAFWFYLLCGAVLGGTNSLCNGSLGALMMTRTVDADRGKVGSAMNGVSRFFSITALVLGGVVGTMVGPRTAFVLGGAAGLVVVAAAALWLHRGVAGKAGARRPGFPATSQPEGQPRLTGS